MFGRWAFDPHSRPYNSQVAIFGSAKFSHHAGMRGVLMRVRYRPQDEDLDQADIAQHEHPLVPWGDFLTEHNELFLKYFMDHLIQPVPLGQPPLVQDEEAAIMAQQSFLPAETNASIEPEHPQEYLYMTLTAEIGPHVDVDPVGQVARVDALFKDEIKFSNPNLLNLLFPWISPLGIGFFQLKMSKKKLRDRLLEETDWPHFTLKNYCKMVLQSIDRR
ncbi:hypothetical protein BGX21_005911 [Mortierella sp. AD011]|nr:hypothetical protein BGX20_005927 [Mortierella sp. AD010]KAF9369549.1 hypothetical protein BGX21_005911 [Mortierella sp. AD011]